MSFTRKTESLPSGLARQNYCQWSSLPVHWQLLFLDVKFYSCSPENFNFRSGARSDTTSHFESRAQSTYEL